MEPSRFTVKADNVDVGRTKELETTGDRSEATNRIPIPLPEVKVESHAGFFFYAEWEGYRIFSGIPEDSAVRILREFFLIREGYARFFPGFMQPKATVGDKWLVLLPAEDNSTLPTRAKVLTIAQRKSQGVRLRDLQINHIEVDLYRTDVDAEKLERARSEQREAFASANALYFSATGAPIPYWFSPPKLGRDVTAKRRLIFKGYYPVLRNIARPVVFLDFLYLPPLFVGKMPPIDRLFGAQGMMDTSKDAAYLGFLRQYFCSWAIIKNRKHIDRFWTFMDRLRTQLVTEKLFEECFDIPYAEMARLLNGWSDEFGVNDSVRMMTAVYSNAGLMGMGAFSGDSTYEYTEDMKHEDFDLGKIPEMPPVKFVELTRANLAALRSSWELGYYRADLATQEGAAVENAPMLQFQTIPRLEKLYADGDRDPELMGLHGIALLFSEQRKEAALKLEEAYEAGNRRPFFLQALAAGKLEVAKAMNKEKGTPLSATLIGRILTQLGPCMESPVSSMETDGLYLNLLMLQKSPPSREQGVAMGKILIRSRAVLSHLHLVSILCARSGRMDYVQGLVKSLDLAYRFVGATNPNEDLKRDIQALLKVSGDPTLLAKEVEKQDLFWTERLQKFDTTLFLRTASVPLYRPR